MMTRLFIYFSEILDKPVLDCDFQYVGKLHDIALRLSEEVYPKAGHLIVRKGNMKKQFCQVPINDVDLSEDIVKLKIEKNELQFSKQYTKGDLMMRTDILDQQVVDTDHQKVERVNDVHLLRVDNQLFLAHVDVGVRGLVRRLGWTRVVDALVRVFAQQSPYLTAEDFVSWKNTQVLTLGRTKNVLRLAFARQRLAQIPPTELAEIIEDLDTYEKMPLFKSLDVSTQRKVFTDLAPNDKQELIDQLEDKEAVSLLENIPADEATDLLLNLPKPKTLQLMRLMHTETSKRLRKLLGFAKDSAGGLMTMEYLSLPQEAVVKDAIQKIKENAQYPGNIAHIYIVDNRNRLIATTTLRRFINKEENTPILETCFSKRIFVRTNDGMEEVALLLEKYKFSSIPVLDEEDVLQGVITSDDVLEELISLAWSKYKEKL